MKRTLQPLKLSKSPLVFVIGQVRFETILAMDRTIVEIQDVFRKAGFTGYTENAIEIDVLPAPGRPVETKKLPQWEFRDGNKKRAILVDRNAVSYQTTGYTTYEEFEKDLRLAVEVVERFAGPKECQRIGLRFVDTIMPAGSKNFDWYVNGQLLGISFEKYGKLLGRSRDHFIEMSPGRRLKVRYTQAARGIALPPDLLPLTLAPKYPLKCQEPFALLDSDHFDGTVTKFSSADVIERIAGLHDLLDQVFRELVTPNALKEWA